MRIIEGFIVAHFKCKESVKTKDIKKVISGFTLLEKLNCSLAVGYNLVSDLETFYHAAENYDLLKDNEFKDTLKLLNIKVQEMTFILSDKSLR